jgi:hypothetical protein
LENTGSRRWCVSDEHIETRISLQAQLYGMYNSQVHEDFHIGSMVGRHSSSPHHEGQWRSEPKKAINGISVR